MQSVPFIPLDSYLTVTPLKYKLVIKKLPCLARVLLLYHLIDDFVSAP